MALPETLRQLLAGALSSAAFLGALLGLGLIWPVALGAGVAVWGATLLLVERRAPRGEARLPGGLRQSDVDAALAELADAEARLDAAAGDLGRDLRGELAAALRDMADGVGRIRAAAQARPQVVRQLRRFRGQDLPLVVAAGAAYADLSARAGPAQRDRLEAAARRIVAFAPAVAAAEAAALERDLAALEVKADLLDAAARAARR